MAGDVGPETEDRPIPWSARAIAQRHRAALGKPLSPVMQTAATACELAHDAAGRPPLRDAD